MSRTVREPYERNVFVNCPFDEAYLPLFDALLFVIHACGFRVRCALEVEDSGQSRIYKLLQIIRECALGVHDISRVELDAESRLPRFNMPFELGLFLSAAHFGTGIQKHKQCLILDAQPYRYQQCLSDIAGQDIKSHAQDPQVLIRRVRDWLRSCGDKPPLPGATAITRSFELFRSERSELLAALKLKAHDLVYLDRAAVIAAWLKRQSNNESTSLET